MLYPQNSETRQDISLDGVWRFQADVLNADRNPAFAHAPLPQPQAMPVPASYNEITQDVSLRDHIGWVWYERDFFVPAEWADKQIRLRVGAANHQAVVYLNGTEIGSHHGGFLPFELDLAPALRRGGRNRLTIAVDNRLHYDSLPHGEVRVHDDPADRMHPVGHTVQEIHFDFANYSGLHRPVRLLVLPQNLIEDIRITTDLRDGKGIVTYAVETGGADATAWRVVLRDRDGNQVASADGASGELRVEAPRPWSPADPHLYELEVSLEDSDGSLLDRYRERVGIRSVEVRGTQFLLNGEPVYFKGFGRHEDMDVRGRGLDHAMLVKDYNLMRWIGANSFRTSHYPYAEEQLRMADELGFLVIDEVQCVGFASWGPGTRHYQDRISPKTQENHLQFMREMIARDKNHPCVVMWSVGNEVNSQEAGSRPYFEPIFGLTRELDPTRPVTCVEQGLIRASDSHILDLSDVVCVNRYYSWYEDCGQLALIPGQARKDLLEWHEVSGGKPVMVTEFGADSVAGLHRDPPEMFSEEYQRDYYRLHFEVFDSFPWFIGEQVWNFADFATKEGFFRVAGNKKGIFTRQRQPKAAAFLLRERWLGIRGAVNNIVGEPDNLRT